VEPVKLHVELDARPLTTLPSQWTGLAKSMLGNPEEGETLRQKRYRYNDTTPPAWALLGVP
jgi:hypothetical protein